MTCLGASQTQEGSAKRGTIGASVSIRTREIEDMGVLFRVAHRSHLTGVGSVVRFL